MADVGGDNRTELDSWEWEPSRRYGPFIFGTPLKSVPYVGSETDREEVGSGDVSASYASELPGYSLAFWNGLLNGVESYRSFKHHGAELIGATYEEVRHLFDTEPIIRNYDPILMIVYDELDLVLFADMAWHITSVYVAVDPEELPG